MARKATKAKSKAEVNQKSVDLVARVRERFKVMEEADHTNRQHALEDLKFTNEPGAQWDALMRKFRGERPCYEFNELRIKCKRIINDMRANRPQAKVRGTEDSTKKTAEIYEGLGRNIWNISDADTIIDAAGEYQVAAGIACWRVVTDYASDDSFDQDILVEGIKNPFCLYCDPAAKDPLKRDAEDWILTEKISRAAYEKRWPNAELVDFDGSRFDDHGDWGTHTTEEEVRIAEYWYKEPIDVEIWKLKDGRVVDASDPASKALEGLVAKKRTVKSHQIMMAIVSGNAVLEQPQVCAGKQHRFVMIHGESIVIEGKTKWFGLPRFAKDAQRNFNIAQTTAMESTAQSLQSKYWATEVQAQGMAQKWNEAIQKNIPFMLYNFDARAPGPPPRVGGPELPVAMLQLGEQASNLMKTVTGIYDASLGAPSNEQTGRAIIARQQQGDIATFNYQDNMAKGIQRTWEIFIDLIPEIYDTERQLRILGADGAEDYVTVNQVVPNPQDPTSPMTVHDLNQGRYDVTITTGPNFSTKRQEATEMYGQLVAQFPQIMSVAGDLIAKSWDLPYSEQIAERLQTLLPAPIQQMLNKDKQMPPEVQQAMAQVNQAMQQVQQMGQMVQAAAAELEQKQVLNDKQKAEIGTAQANLKTAQANFDKDVAQQLLALQTAQFAAEKAISQASDQAQGQVAQQQQDLGAMVQASVSEIQNVVAQFMGAAGSTLQQIHSQTQAIAAQPPRPKLVAAHAVRDPQTGQLSAMMQYEQPQPSPPSDGMPPSLTPQNM